jgi:hypothetical protein
MINYTAKTPLHVVFLYTGNIRRSPTSALATVVVA